LIFSRYFDSTFHPCRRASWPVKKAAEVVLPLRTQSKNLVAATANLPPMPSETQYVPSWPTFRLPFHEGVPWGRRR
jgi:hypothetical protein